jgi:hypothetical protein
MLPRKAGLPLRPASSLPCRAAFSTRKSANHPFRHETCTLIHWWTREATIRERIKYLGGFQWKLRVIFSIELCQIPRLNRFACDAFGRSSEEKTKLKLRKWKRHIVAPRSENSTNVGADRQNSSQAGLLREAASFLSSELGVLGTMRLLNRKETTGARPLYAHRPISCMKTRYRQ